MAQRGDDLTIVIPTKNSARHIDIILDFYRSVGVAPIVFVDDSSVDDTYDVCLTAGFRTELIRNPLGRVEGMIEEMSRRSPTDWILRFDDDEVPSKSILARVHELIQGDPARQHAFRLRHAMLNGDEGFSALASHEDPPHDQWRLYHRRHVTFIDDIHSPGIVVRDGIISPPADYFLHLQWIVRSLDERRAKMEDYDRQVADAGSSWRTYYLIEEDPAALDSACGIDLPEFAALAKRLASRFPSSVRLPLGRATTLGY